MKGICVKEGKWLTYLTLILKFGSKSGWRCCATENIQSIFNSFCLVRLNSARERDMQKQLKIFTLNFCNQYNILGNFGCGGL